MQGYGVTACFSPEMLLLVTHNVTDPCAYSLGQLHRQHPASPPAPTSIVPAVQKQQLTYQLQVVNDGAAF
jgi:hypothetical protein